MSMDDLLKGISVFNDGITQLATTNAINDAHQQLTALNQQALDKTQALQAHTQIAQDLGMRLTAAGADAAHIQTVTSQLAPSQGAQYEAGVNADLQQKSQDFQSGEKAKDRANAIELERMKLSALTGKGGQKAIDEAMKGFEKRPDIKPLLDNFPKIDEALQRVNETKGKMGATAALNLAKLGLIRGAAGRVNEKEIEGADESPSVRAKLWKQMGLQSTGEVPANVQDFWQGVLKKSKEHIGSQLQQGIAAHAKGAAAANDMIDETRLNTALSSKFGNILGNTATQVAEKQQVDAAKQANITKLETWLNSDAGKQPEMASRRADVIKALSKLKGQ